jgi:hypothetical protein
MSIKDIYKRLNLTSDLITEEKRFINRITEILKHAHNIISPDMRHNIKHEITLELGETRPLSLPGLIKNNNFNEALVVAEIFLQILHKVGSEYYTYFSSKIENTIDLSIVDLGYVFKGGKIYKKGAAELDEKLILEPLEWLGDFPKARKFFENSLREYLKRDYPDTITKCYSALESLVKTFLGNNKNLKANTVKLIEKIGLPKEWGNILFNFCQYANEFSSRHGKKEGGKKISVDSSLVEAYIYFTGLVMRLIIKSAQ